MPKELKQLNEKTTFHFKDIILTAIILCSWVLFPFVTYGSESMLHFVPLLLLISQICVLLLYRKRKLLLSIFFNPVVCLALYYTVKPTINYLKQTPTIMHCCYSFPGSPSFDPDKSVFIDYYDDDCDWEGLYYYTHDINNFVTNGWISVFGNPIVNKQQGNQ